MYRRIVLKLSGEGLAHDATTPIAPERLAHYAREIAQARRQGHS